MPADTAKIGPGSGDPTLPLCYNSVMKLNVKGSALPALESTIPANTLVMYENDGAPIIGVVLQFKKQRYLVANDRGREVELDAARLHLLPTRAPSFATSEERIKYLQTLHREGLAQAQQVQLEELWGVIHSEQREYDTAELATLLLGDNSLRSHLALRFALLADNTYFKRRKHEFSPRPAEVVEELKTAERVRREREQAFQKTLLFMKARIDNPALPLPPEVIEPIRALEDIAVESPHIDPARQKEAKEFLERAGEALRIEHLQRLEQRAFALLERIHHFTANTNLSLIRYRPPQEFSQEALSEAERIQALTTSEPGSRPEGARRDLTALRVFTIDDISTRDMDDALSCEAIEGGYRIGVHITDLAAVLPCTGALDAEAKLRATSIYCPGKTINMLPEILSEERLSLRPDEVRGALSVFFELDHEFNVSSTEIVPSLIRSAQRYTYEQVDQLLDQGDSLMLALHQAAIARETERIERGAHKVSKREVIVSALPSGELTLTEVDEESPARALVAEMMVMANHAYATFAASRGIALAFRGQEAPDESAHERHQEIPPGPALDFAMRMRLKKSTAGTAPLFHAGLALDAYAQLTSPIRRYLDLCNQRQVLSYLRVGTPHYTEAELATIIQETELALSHANSISKESKRFWILSYLKQEMRRAPLIEATVVRTGAQNPLVELEKVHITVPAKFKKQPTLGTRVTLRIIAVDPRTDYLKLEPIES